MMVVDGVFFIVGILFLLVFCYLFFLSAVSFLPEEKKQRLDPLTRFAIIIPAHDEAELIGSTLDALGAVDYPQELYDVVVIADNCADETA